MTPARRGIAPLLLIALLAGCGTGQQVGGEAPALADLVAGTWPDAIRLSNGTAVVIVVPSIGGRIMKYALVDDGTNALWVNPKLTRETTAATTTSWKNWGGDKSWPWPQDQWPLHLGREWPPPLEADQRPMKARMLGSLGVQLVSEPIEGYGVQMVRQITLAPSGSRVSIVTRFQRASADLPPAELAAWQIAQVPAKGKLYARRTPGATIRPLPPSTSVSMTTRPVSQESRIVAIDSPGSLPAKVGLDADALAWSAGELLFVMSSTESPASERRIRPGERAQVFVQKPASGGGASPAYAELEFTSARQDLARGHVPELRVTWDLLRRENQTWKASDVAAVLSR